MEWISHGTTGALIGNAIVPPGERPARAVAWWVGAALSPDVFAVISHNFGDIHRGVGHSLYALPVMALLFAYPAWRWGRNSAARLWRLWLAFALAIASHLLLDALSCYRWYPAWPFSRENWSVGVMPMFDVYIFAGWLVVLVWRWRKPTLQSTALAGLVVFALGVGVRVAGKSIAADHTILTEVDTQRRWTPPTVPDYWRPWIWHIRTSDGEREWIPVNILDGQPVGAATTDDPRRIGIGFGGM